MTKTERVARWFSVLCAAPWLLIVAAYIEFGAAFVVLSRWPRPNLDDPKLLASAPFHLVVQMLFVLTCGAIPLLIATAVKNWPLVLRDLRYALWIATFAIGLIVIAVLGQYDPGQVWTWLAD